MSIRSQSIDIFETSHPVLSLIFQPDDPTRTDIIDGNTGQLYYSVDTIKQRKHQLTLVRRAASPLDSPSTIGEETIIASFEWHRYKSDMISFGDNMPTPATSWLKRSMNPFNTYVFRTRFPMGNADSHHVFQDCVLQGPNLESVSMEGKLTWCVYSYTPVTTHHLSPSFTDNTPPAALYPKVHRRL